ncbi:MAG: bifunctional precorrin-2 dehydrogenase/sirohydrochlorin ferrochelatase, partial [Bacteroidetes bacterium]
MATRNNLYPIFLKLQRLNVLIVGGGSVGLEKLSFLLKSSPDARVTLVAKEIAPAIRNLALHSPEAEVILRQKPFEAADLQGHDLVIAATNDRRLNERVRREAKRQGLLVNVADTPDLCDFYLGAIVTKGHLKVAISTNGQSPTFAKRFR